MARSTFVSMLMLQVPRPLSQCITLPMQALFGPLQLAIIKPDAGLLTGAIEGAVAAVVIAVELKPPAATETEEEKIDISIVEVDVVVVVVNATVAGTALS